MFRVVSKDLEHLAAGARVFPKALRAGVRKNLAAVARDGVNASKAAIRGMPSNGGVPYHGDGGLRADIATAVRVAAGVNTATGASARIYVARTAALTAHNRYRVAELIDEGAFRHPVFGHRESKWARQSGHPYFKTVLERKRPALAAGMIEALDEAVKSTMPNVR